MPRKRPIESIVRELAEAVAHDPRWGVRDVKRSFEDEIVRVLFAETGGNVFEMTRRAGLPRSTMYLLLERFNRGARGARGKAKKTASGTSARKR